MYISYMMYRRSPTRSFLWFGFNHHLYSCIGIGLAGSIFWCKETFSRTKTTVSDVPTNIILGGVCQSYGIQSTTKYEHRSTKWMDDGMFCRFRGFSLWCINCLRSSVCGTAPNSASFIATLDVIPIILNQAIKWRRSVFFCLTFRM